jgi:tetratricopeptide (TPR) repeat protein
MESGREALEAKRYAEAVPALTEACQLMPNDETARNLLSQAKEAKRKFDHAQAMIAGREASMAKNYQRAFDAFSEALQLMPGDKDATALRAEVEFPLRVEQGNAALEAKHFGKAVEAFTTATQLKPEDQASRLLLQRAQEAHRQLIKADYDRAMASGRDSLSAKTYEAAFHSFTQALTLMPGDEQAATLSQEAEFYMCLERGRKALERKEFGTAVGALERANQLRPEDEETAGHLQQAREVKSKHDAAVAAAKKKQDEDRKKAMAAAAAAAARQRDIVNQRVRRPPFGGR